MMQLLRPILHRLRPSALLLMLVVAAALILWLPGHRALACWNTVETQCFSQNPVPLDWGPSGWMHPQGSNRYWKRYPNYPYDYVSISAPSWDWQREIFDDHMCWTDVGQSIWCAGYPRSNDPRYDTYPANDSAYVVYGPFSLETAVAGGCSFYLYDRSEIAHDTIFWGLTTIPPPNWKMHLAQYHDSIYISGSYSGIMQDIDFQQKTMDFARVHRINTPLDTVSLLGRSQVWLFWRFKADANSNVDKGAFIDNVSVSWDDGGVDLTALCGGINNLDGTPAAHPREGDSVYANLSYMTCPGGIRDYQPFRAVAMLDTMVILDTTIAGDTAGGVYWLQSHRFVLPRDTHRIYMKLDSLDEIQETNEANDSCSFRIVVPRVWPPAAFDWIAPHDSTLAGDQTVTLRWEAYCDPDNPATVSFFSSTQASGCAGIAIPNGVHPVMQGEDSLVWDLTPYYYGRVLNVYARIHDAHNDTCVYAPFPVVRRHVSNAVGDGAQNLIPDHFYLDQNYPNPFNPTTDLRYGIAHAGHVTLKVFDLLGREVATLVNAERSPGTYSVTFDGSKLPSGLYLYSLSTPEGTQSRKMMLMK